MQSFGRYSTQPDPLNQKALSRGHTDHFINTFPPVIVDSVSFAFEFDQGSIQTNQRSKYLDQRLFSSKIFARKYRHIDTPHRLRYLKSQWSVADKRVIMKLLIVTHIVSAIAAACSYLNLVSHFSDQAPIQRIRRVTVM